MDVVVEAASLSLHSAAIPWWSMCILNVSSQGDRRNRDVSFFLVEASQSNNMASPKLKLHHLHDKRHAIEDGNPSHSKLIDSAVWTVRGEQ
jgi:hypothetical protein